MAKYVCNGALVSCNMAVPLPPVPPPLVPPPPMPAAPVPLTVLPVKRVMLNKNPMASEMDFVPIVNIPTFGACMSPANPGVQAALGAPVPCVPTITSPWSSPKQNVKLAGEAALLNNSTCSCELGKGIITVFSPGQATVNEG